MLEIRVCFYAHSASLPHPTPTGKKTAANQIVNIAITLPSTPTMSQLASLIRTQLDVLVRSRAPYGTKVLYSTPNTIDGIFIFSEDNTKGWVDLATTMQLADRCQLWCRRRSLGGEGSAPPTLSAVLSTPLEPLPFAWYCTRRVRAAALPSEVHNNNFLEAGCGVPSLPERVRCVLLAMRAVQCASSGSGSSSDGHPIGFHHFAHVVQSCGIAFVHHKTHDVWVSMTRAPQKEEGGDDAADVGRVLTYESMFDFVCRGSRTEGQYVLDSMFVQLHDLWAEGGAWER
eukprot:PhM_4_TR10742/c0_g1_i1/m.2462